jgi:hypothetical protein
LGDTAEESKGPHMPAQPMRKFLGWLDLRVDVAAGRKRGHKNRCPADLTRLRVGDGNRHPGVIHLHFLARLVRQAHGIGVGFVPALVIHPELGEPVPIGMLFPVLLPEQRQGYAALG